MGAVARAVASAVPPAVGVDVNSRAQRGPRKPMTGKSIVPPVPRTAEPAEDQMAWQPAYATTGGTGQALTDGSTGAPSVPEQVTALFKRGPIDPHYTVPSERNPYRKVNSPPTRGMMTFIKAYANGIFLGKQNVDQAGWQVRSPQQRTSYMRFLPPPYGGGYAPETAVPHQLPQQPRTQRFLPVLGSDAPGVGVLNSSTYGAGQTAGGIGGNQYTPSPGPPDTTSTAGQPGGASGMPTWG